MMMMVTLGMMIFIAMNTNTILIIVNISTTLKEYYS